MTGRRVEEDRYLIGVYVRLDERKGGKGSMYTDDGPGADTSIGREGTFATTPTTVYVIRGYSFFRHDRIGLLDERLL